LTLQRSFFFDQSQINKTYPYSWEPQTKQAGYAGFFTSREKIMRYPNLRYGNPTELAAYVQGIPIAAIAKRLRRSERTVRNWLDGRQKVPWWVPEIIRLQNMESWEIRRQMNMLPKRADLQLVRGQLATLPAPVSAPASPVDAPPSSVICAS
jgi:hypothetical protein